MTTGSDLASRQAAFDEWLMALHGEHRHGRDDRLGSLNYVDANARRRGKDAIRDGLSVSLSRDLVDGPNARHDGRASVELELLTTDWGREDFQLRTERLTLDCHGPANTHIDALNHLAWHGRWYNGRPIGDPDPGGTVLDLANSGIFTRGVYVDVPLIRGERYVSTDRPVDGADIDAALARAGFTFQPGDALLLDCGRDVFEQEVGAWGEQEVKPGSGVGVAEWIADHKPGLLLWDMLDVSGPDEIRSAVHQVHWAIGLVLVDSCTYERARPLLAERRRAEGGLAIAPLRADGATGCNVNPLLIL